MAFRDIRRSRRRLSAEEIRLFLLAFFLLVGLLALNIYLARTLPGGELFYQRWSGARAFLVEGIGPYSRAIAERVQQVAYGRTALASEYSYVLNDPFYIVLFYTPLALFSDFAVARGLWMLFSETALIGIVLYSLRIAEWEPPPWLFLCLVGLGVFGYFSLLAVVSGTPAILLTFLCLAILLSLRSFSDELAGALLFLVAYQWEVSALFFLFIMVFVLANHRWRVMAGFGMSLVVLLVISFLSYPGWGLPYIRAVLSDWYRSGGLTFGHIASLWLPKMDFPLYAWISAGLVVILFVEWLRSIRAHIRHVMWTASLSLAATPLLGFAIFPSSHVTLIPAFALILMLVWERWIRQRVWFTVIILLVTLLVPFGLYARMLTGSDRLAQDLLSVLPPIATILGLYWMRWWAVRSPRIWSDQIGDRT
jgi:hypothetical protein